VAGLLRSEVVAGTLIQNPEPYVNCADRRWDENALFIANARADVPRLIAEIRRLRAERNGGSSS